MEKLQIPNLPKLNGGTSIVQSKDLTLILEYINTQTEIINTLSQAILSLEQLCENHSITLSTLQNHISTIAKAIGGQLDA